MTGFRTDGSSALEPDDEDWEEQQQKDFSDPDDHSIAQDYSEPSSSSQGDDLNTAYYHHGPKHGEAFQTYFDQQNQKTRDSLAGAEKSASDNGKVIPFPGNNGGGDRSRDITRQEHASNTPQFNYTNNSKSGGKGKQQGNFYQHHKKGIIGRIIGILLGVGGFGLGVLVSGPAQLLQALNFVRDVKLYIADAQTASRYLRDMSSVKNLLSGFAEGDGVSGAVRNSRLGIMGNKLADKLINRMDAKGISFDSGVLGQDRGMTIDPVKYSGDENLKITNDEAGNRWVQQTTGLSEGDYRILDNGTVHIEESISRSAEKRLIYQLNDIGRFDIISKIEARLTLTKIGKLSMFHPIKKAEQALLKQLENFIKAKAQEIKSGHDALDPAAKDGIRKSGENIEKQNILDSGGDPANPQYAKQIAQAGDDAVKFAEDNIAKIAADAGEAAGAGFRGILSNIADVAGDVALPLIIIQVLCTLQSLYNGAGAYKQANVVNTAEGGVAFILGTASQMQSGQDIDLQQIGNAVNMTLGDEVPVKDKSGNVAGTQFSSAWNAAPVRAELGETYTTTGPGNDQDQVPAALTNVAQGGFNFFSPGINNALSIVLNNPLMSGVCWIYDKISGIISSILGIFLDPLLKILGLDTIINNLMNAFLGIIYGDPLNLTSLLPQGWGSVMMYGGLFMSNEHMRAVAGNNLTTQESAQLKQDQNEFLAWRESQRPLIARLFDPTDYNSSVNQIARAANFDTSNQSIGTQLGNVVRLFASVPNLFGAALGLIGGSTTGAMSPIPNAYQYGTPDAPVPDIAYTDTELSQINSDSNYDMIINAGNVFKELDRELEDPDVGPNWRSTALTCWGVNIGSGPDYNVTAANNEAGDSNQAGGWNYVTQISKSFQNMCNDSSLLPLRTYILDFYTMASGSCFEGDPTDKVVQTACQDMSIPAAN